MPTMVSKPAATGAAFPGPDFAAMRRRRDADLPSVRQLQEKRGIAPGAPQDNPHQEILEAYGYRQLVDGLFAVPRMTMNAVRQFASYLPDLHVGPQGAAADPLSASTLEDLILDLEADADCWVSPAAKQAADTRGLLVVLDYHYYDWSSHNLNARLMQKFQAGRGDRFFMEGLDPEICRVHDLLFQLREGTCRLLEKDSGMVWKFMTMVQKMNLQVQQRFEYVRTHLPDAPPAPELHDHQGITNYLERWAPHLPLAARAGYDNLKKKYAEVSRQYHEMVRETLPQRGQYMADVLKRDRGMGWNFVIAGADHMPALRQHLSDLPCVFMTPKKVVESNPQRHLRKTAKDQL